MNFKDMSIDSFSRKLRIKKKEVRHPSFLGYLKRCIEARNFEISKYGSSLSVKICNNSKTNQNHDIINCKACVGLNYVLWRKIRYKDGYDFICPCCYDFFWPLARHLRKEEFIKTIKAYDNDEFEFEPYDLSKEDILDVKEDECYVKLGDFL
jgi:hypothetical protein